MLGFPIAAAVIGVVVGVVPFVCSVGNVPSAVFPWNNGITFGGVMSFIVADLIVPTIDDAYRRYYGLRLATVLCVSVLVTAILAGVTLHSAWAGIGLIPPACHAGGTAPGGHTTSLNAIFTLVVAGQLYLTDGPDAGGPEMEHHPAD